MDKLSSLLLVEDNPADADLVSLYLEGTVPTECSIHICARLQQAFSHLKSTPTDLVILDLNLPDSNGLETLRGVVAAAPNLPVVVLTGSDDEHLGLSAIREGAQDFIGKGQLSRPTLSRSLRYSLARKTSELQIRNAEAQVRTILDALDLQVLLLDIDHRVIWPNQATCRAFNKYREQIVGSRCYELWQQSEPCEECMISKTIASRSPQTTYHRPIDGKIWDIKACPIIDEAGMLTSIVELRTDITDRLQLEQQFYQAQKMEAVGRLAGGIAHDFNNMLSVIIGFAEMAKTKNSTSQEIQDCLDEILQAGSRSTELVRQLLAFSRKQTITPEIVDCNELLLKSMKMLHRLVGEDIEIRFKPFPELWKVKIDPTQLDQVIVNLIVNSRDAIKGVGLISIETANLELDDTYCKSHMYATPGEYVCLAISDTGIGMSREVLQRIFEPFFTTKQLGKGTGLGMSTIFGIIKQHDGMINAYSEPGQGTTIKIYLPRSTETTTEKTVTKATVREGNNETILIVEDDPAILRICRKILESCGYRVLTADHPELAIELAGNTTDTIHLLLTDTIMPGMNGVQLRQQIETHRPDIKTMFMSGYTDDIIAYHGVLEQGVNFMHKPFTRNQLIGKVREALDR